jgi:hypothetical protein
MAVEKTPRSEEQEDVVEHSPEKLLSGFAKGHMVLWMILAVVIHVVLIGSLSLGYIQDRWIDPEGAEVRKEAAKEAARLAKQREDAKANPKKHGTNVVAGTTGTNAAAMAGVTNAMTNATQAVSSNTTEQTEEAALLEAHKDAPVVKEITATATTNEIPTGPDGIGIPIEATNPR